MKQNRNMSNFPQTQAAGNRPMPQNKDDLDSRKNEEQHTKGDDITHNEKNTQSDKKKVKND